MIFVAWTGRSPLAHFGLPWRAFLTTREYLRSGKYLVILAVALQLCSACTITRLTAAPSCAAITTQIVQGKSTRHDVLRLLGPPDSIEHQTWGDAFIYRYRQVNSSSITIREPVFVRQTIFQF
jgi:hypothetical protein